MTNFVLKRMDKAGYGKSGAPNGGNRAHTRSSANNLLLELSLGTARYTQMQILRQSWRKERS